MTQREFLDALDRRLAGIPEAEREASKEFYAESIADRMEDGVSEEEAVAAVGSVDEIADRILSELPLNVLVKARVRERGKLGGWAIAGLIAGFPVWFPLLIVAAVLVLVAYLVIWALVLCVYAVGLALALTGAVCIPVGIVQRIMGDPAAQAMLIFAAGLAAAGLAILWFFVCKWATVGAVRLSRAIGRAVKRLFIGRRETK